MAESTVSTSATSIADSKWANTPKREDEVTKTPERNSPGPQRSSNTGTPRQGNNFSEASGDEDVEASIMETEKELRRELKSLNQKKLRELKEQLEAVRRQNAGQAPSIHDELLNPQQSDELKEDIDPVEHRNGGRAPSIHDELSSPAKVEEWKEEIDTGSGLNTGEAPSTQSEVPEDEYPDDNVTASPSEIYKRDETSLVVPIRNSAPKVKDLPVYKGSSIKEFQDWTRSADMHFRLNLQEFVTDFDKIVFGVSHVDDNLKNQWYTYLKGEKPMEMHSWEDFSKFLLECVRGLGNWRFQVEQLHTDARQWPGQAPDQFHAFLASIEAKLPAASEEWKVKEFVTRLQPELRKHMSIYRDRPTTREAAVELAQHIHLTLQRSERKSFSAKERPGPNGWKAIEEQRAYRSDGGYSMAVHVKGDKSVKPDGNFSGTGDLMCHKCGRRGHFASFCRFRDHVDHKPTKNKISAQSFVRKGSSGQDHGFARPTHHIQVSYGPPYH